MNNKFGNVKSSYYLCNVKQTNKPMKTYKLFNIYYDTDGENVELPNEIKVIENDDWNVELEGSDRISDLTGWCVFGFEYEISDVSNN